MEKISLSYPFWYFGLCILLGLAFALLMYWRDRLYRDQPNGLRVLLGALRFLSAAVISALLLAPIINVINTEIRKPVIVIGQDNSESVRVGIKGDSAQYFANLTGLINDLKRDFDIRELTFGSTVIPSGQATLQEASTDISEFLEYVSDNFGDDNLGAVVLASDGLYNRGRNPLYQSTPFQAPLYTIALGDTTQKTDLLIKQVYHNEIAFLGDKFSIQVDVQAVSLDGQNTTLVIEKIDGRNRQRLASEPIRISGTPFFTTRDFVLEADQPGVTRYRCWLAAMPNEVSKVNNVKDFFVDVIDGRLKVLILAHAPHPDLSAYKNALESNLNYEVDVRLISDFQENIEAYSLVLFHQLPSSEHRIDGLITRLDRAGTPRLFVVGGQTALSAFNRVQDLLEISGNRRTANEVIPLPDMNFSLFTTPDETLRQLQTFAPVLAPFGEYAGNPSARVFMYQRIGKVDTQYPLVLFGEDERVKTGIISAEGLWKWRLMDYLQHRNHEMFDGLVTKFVQYLSVKEDKRPFRAAPFKKLFLENEPVLFDAELYNQSFELINAPDAFLEVRDAEGQQYPYVFNKSGKMYTIDIGRFPVGDYTYTASVDYQGKRLTSSGKFAIQPVQLESYETTADHRLLRTLAGNQGGAIVYPAQLSTIADRIRENQNIKPLVYQSTSSKSIIHLRWIFFVIFLLLVMEWFLRRYFGGY